MSPFSPSLSWSCLGVVVLCLAGCDSGGSSGPGGGGGGAGGSGAGTSGEGGTAGAGGATTGVGGTGVTTTSEGAGGTGTTSSATGGSGAGGNPGGGCADLPLCDDFEDAAVGGPPDAAKWTIGSPNCSGTGAISIDGAVARSGSRSVRIDGKGGYCNHVFLGNAAVVPTLGDVLYGRFYARFAKTLPQGHTTFLAMKDAADGGKDLRMGGQNTILMYNRESDDATLPVLSPAGTALSKGVVPETWMCIEFRIDGANGTLETRLDGAPVEGLVIDGAPTPEIDQAWINQKPNWKPDLQDWRLGWEDYSGNDMTLWIDDVALSTSEIGCL